MSGDALEPENYYVAGDEADPEEARNVGKKDKGSQVKQEVQQEMKKKKKSIFEDADLSSCPPDELKGIFAKHIAKAFPSASSLEIDEMHLQSTAFAQGLRSRGSAKALEGLLFDHIDGWQAYCTDAVRQPRVLVIASSAIRCVDILKDAPRLRQRCTIAKLFAKHIKVPEQVAFLASHKVPLAIGTPARILKLAQTALNDKDESAMAIDLSAVEHVVLDGWRDAKDRTIFDVAEVRLELLRLLTSEVLLRRLNTGKAKITFL
jgi:protein CMS1